MIEKIINSLKKIKKRSSVEVVQDPQNYGIAERIIPGTASWDEAYPMHIQRYEFVSQSINQSINQSLNTIKVLDAGCGTGYGAAFLVDQGVGSVVAVDIAAEALDIGRKLFNRENIVWLRDDCHTLQDTSKYDPLMLYATWRTWNISKNLKGS
jgi:SAM-dependent methyltransferase